MQLTLGTAPGCLADKLEAIATSLEGLQESLIFGLVFLDQSCAEGKIWNDRFLVGMSHLMCKFLKGNCTLSSVAFVWLEL